MDGNLGVGGVRRACHAYREGRHCRGREPRRAAWFGGRRRGTIGEGRSSRHEVTEYLSRSGTVPCLSYIYIHTRYARFSNTAMPDEIASPAYRTTHDIFTSAVEVISGSESRAGIAFLSFALPLTYASGCLELSLKGRQVAAHRISHLAYHIFTRNVSVGPSRGRFIHLLHILVFISCLCLAPTTTTHLEQEFRA